MGAQYLRRELWTALLDTSLREQPRVRAAQRRITGLHHPLEGAESLRLSAAGIAATTTTTTVFLELVEGASPRP